METPDKLYYTISEVAEMLSVNASLIRFWEKEFENLVKPKKTRNGKRMFSTQDIEILKQIYFLTKDKGYTLAGAKNFLQSSRKSVDKNVAIGETLKKLKGFLIELKDQLNDI